MRRAQALMVQGTGPASSGLAIVLRSDFYESTVPLQVRACSPHKLLCGPLTLRILSVRDSVLCWLWNWLSIHGVRSGRLTWCMSRSHLWFYVILLVDCVLLPEHLEVLESLVCPELVVGMALLPSRIVCVGGIQCRRHGCRTAYDQEAWRRSFATLFADAVLGACAQIHAGGSAVFSDLQLAWKAFLDWGRRNLEGGL